MSDVSVPEQCTICGKSAVEVYLSTGYRGCENHLTRISEVQHAFAYLRRVVVGPLSAIWDATERTLEPWDGQLCANCKVPMFVRGGLSLCDECLNKGERPATGKEDGG